MQKKYRNTTPPATELGKYLRSRRLELGIGQVEIAQRAGMTQSNYSTLERGKYASLGNHLDGLAVALQCEPSELQVFIPAPQEKKPQTALGVLISSRRQSLGLSIQELADQSGISLEHLNLLELGSRDLKLRYSTIHKLARELHLDISAFYDFICVTGFKEKKTESPLGDAVRSRRKKLGLSIADVAQALHTSSQFISQIELGIVGLTKADTFLVQLAAVLQIDPEYLRGLRQRRRIKATKKAPVEPRSLAAFVFSRRLELGLTQRRIAERVGVSNDIISKIEAGEAYEPRGGVAFWRNLAAALECEIPQALISMSRSEDIDRIKELAGIGPDDAARKGVQLLRRLLERQRDGFVLFFAKDGDLVELELLL